MTPERLAEIERAWCTDDPSTDVNEARAIRELVAEVRALTAAMDGVINALGCDFTDYPQVAGVVAEKGRLGAEMMSALRALRARVAELEESARWRPASERPEVSVDVEVCVRTSWGGFERMIGRWLGENAEWAVVSCVPDLAPTDADVFGWRPLGPGPEVK